MTLMGTELTREVAAEQIKDRSAHGSKGFVRLLTLSGITMAIALPIGIYPRLLQGQNLEKDHQKLVDKLPAVTVSHPSQAAPSRKISLPGTVDALLETAIYARTSGYIRERYADIGDHVTRGQVLADIETPEVDESAKEAKSVVLTTVATRAQTQANLEKAKADLDTAIADLAQAKANLLVQQTAESFAQRTSVRWVSLAQQGAVSHQDADEKDTQFKSNAAATLAAKERLRSAQSQVVAARTRLSAEHANIDVSDANIESAKARQNRTNFEQGFNKVVAPFAGVITERNIDPGMLITSGSENSKFALYRLARIDTVKVYADVPQFVASGIKIGQPVSITLKEFPGKTFIGKVERTSVALDSTARTLRTEIHVTNSDLRLAPGMYADVNFFVPRPAHTFLIPANSLVTRAEGPQVVVASGNSVQYRNVQLGDDLGKQVEVVSGLIGTESIVMNPSDSLRDGTRVRVEKD